MSQYVHHIPGRLRVRSPWVRRDETRAAVVKQLLERYDGVRSVQVSTLTGSITVAYDPAAIQHTELMQMLKDRGYLASTATVTAGSSAGKPFPSQDLGHTIARRVATSLVEFALERSLLAIVAAVL